MTGQETNWVPGLIALGIALVVAIGFLLASLRKHLPVPAPGLSEDLEIRYQGLIAALKEHTANKHLQSPEAWAQEHALLEQDAAAVLRERAGVKHATEKAQARLEKRVAAQAAQATGFLARNPSLKGALVGAGVVGFFVLIGVVLSQESTSREEGQGITGATPPRGTKGPAEGPPPEDPELKAAMARASQAPDDVEALAGAVSQLLRRQMFETAGPMIQRATMIDPYYVPTRTHRAVMVGVQGNTSKALSELEHIANTFEGGYEARLFAGLLAIESQDRGIALEQLEKYLIEAPPSEQPPMLRAAVEELRKELAPRPPSAP